MKTLSALCEDTLKSLDSEKIILCDYVMTPDGACLMEQPILSSEHTCGYCSGKSCYCPYLDPKLSDKRVWLCANHLCDVYTKRSTFIATTPQVTRKRAREWPEFCEISGIGDIHHGVKFEDIQQSPGKVDYLLKFANKPFGVIFMQGDPGTGKTFASMAVCELYTRNNTSCIFTTQKQMLNNWLDTFKSERVSNYIERVTTCCLLVVDDFGVGDVSPGFMSFFMDLINTRTQWTDRGTIITTNLDAKTFALFCGEALSDRINTGQQFVFKGKTRRKQTVL